MELKANQFFTFIAIYAANADAEIESIEINLIIKNFGESLYNEMRELFDRLSDVERLNIIQTNNQYYKEEDSKALLFKKLNEVFKIDGHLNSSEESVLRMLKHIL